MDAIKIVLAGDSEVGKTNILTRYTTDSDKSVPTQFESTKFPDQKKKKLNINGKEIHLDIWELPGNLEFKSPFLKLICQNSDGGFIVYDISKRESFGNVDKWFKALNNNLPENSALILLGNKSDLSGERKIQFEKGEEKAKELNISFYETYASDFKNINNVFNELVQQIIKKKEEPEKKEEEERMQNFYEKEEYNEKNKETKIEKFNKEEQYETKQEESYEKTENIEKKDAKKENEKCDCSSCFK